MSYLYPITESSISCCVSLSFLSLSLFGSLSHHSHFNFEFTSAFLSLSLSLFLFLSPSLYISLSLFLSPSLSLFLSIFLSFSVSLSLSSLSIFLHALALSVSPSTLFLTLNHFCSLILIFSLLSLLRYFVSFCFFHSLFGWKPNLSAGWYLWWMVNISI